MGRIKELDLEREGFEKWARESIFWLTFENFYRHLETKEYLDRDVSLMWRAWKARAGFTSAKGFE